MTDLTFPSQYNQVNVSGSVKLYADDGAIDGWITVDEVLGVAVGVYAPLQDAHLTGLSTCPTAASGTNTNQLANCAFVMGQIANATAGVSSWNGRTGNVTLTLSDVTNLTGTGAAARIAFGLAPVASTGSYADLSNPPGTFAANAAGFVPAPVSTTGRFLRDDGTWVAPSAGVTFAPRVITASANTTLLSSDSSVYFNRTTSPAATTVTLPASPASGLRLMVKDMSRNSDVYPITVQPTSGTLDGAANYVLAQGEALTVEFNSIEWSVL